MSFTDNFGNPKGLLGRMMLVSMDKEHLPMAQWALERIKIPENGKVADLGCGGGYNIRRMLEMSANYKNWVPNGMIAALTAGTAVLGTGTSVMLCSKLDTRLKKGGTFAIHDIMSKSRYGDMQQFISELRNEGFESAELIDTTNGRFMTKGEAAILGLSGSSLLVGKK